MDAYFTAAALLVVAVIYALDRFGYLPKKRTASDAASEISMLERTVKRLTGENARLQQLTDITPILDTLTHVVDALDRHTEMTEQVFSKVADMNGSLRAHGAAMQALADRLILDEAARGLLAAAAMRPKPE